VDTHVVSLFALNSQVSVETNMPSHKMMHVLGSVSSYMPASSAVRSELSVHVASDALTFNIGQLQITSSTSTSLAASSFHTPTEVPASPSLLPHIIDFSSGGSAQLAVGEHCVPSGLLLLYGLICVGG